MSRAHQADHLLPSLHRHALGMPVFHPAGSTRLFAPKESV
jgi:hypothetical protein